MVQQKKSFGKKYIILFYAIVTTIITLASFTTIGTHTSRLDDIAYIDLLNNDLKIYRYNSILAENIKIRKLIEFGIIYMAMDGSNVNIYLPHSDSAKQMKKNLNENVSKRLIHDFKQAKKNIKLVFDLHGFNNFMFMKNTSVLSSFGNTFTERLLLTMKKIHECVVEYVNASDCELDSFLVMSLEEKSIRICLYEFFDNSYVVHDADYIIPQKKGFPTVNEIFTYY
ncbi:hypothetical protein COBT_003657, partial [Conglomerata obtusa]